MFIFRLISCSGGGRVLEGDPLVLDRGPRKKEQPFKS